MIITKTKIVSNSNVAQYAWRRLAQFQNIDFTTKLICDLHQLDSKQKSNARKQAEHIKYCLTQAKEYYDSSEVVSLATKPVLLYYCTMSLALAEVLLKQTGNSRLSALRANHNCHGLALNLASEPNTTESLEVAASKIVAKSQTGSQGQPKGTFEVWRRSAREYPLGGYLTEVHGKTTSERFETLFSPSNAPPPYLARKGINLHDCMTNLPYMADTLRRWGSRLEMVRATVSRNHIVASDEVSTTIIIHPTSADLLDAFGSLCKLHSEYTNILNITEPPSGCIIEWNQNTDLAFSLPHSTCINSKDVYFTCSPDNLGEFGYIYLALHMLGNFARYYPDFWIKHIENNSPLANASDDLCNNVLTRLPLLTLSELSRQYQVLEK